MRMSDAVHFIRQWWLLRKLTARGAAWTLKQLAAEFSVDTRTIRRDFEALGQVGFHLKESTGPHGEKSWCINTDEILAGLTFTFDEIVALYLGRRFLEPLAGTPLWEASQKAFRKLRSGFGESRLNYLDKFATAFHQTSIGGSDYSERGEIIDRLMLCIEESCTAEIIYHSPKDDAQQHLLIHPYGLIYHRGSLYLVAFAPHRNDLRHYKLDRIQAADSTKEKFARPVGFQLAEHLASTFGVFHTVGETQQVRIRFSKTVAHYIQEHQWHPSQVVTQQLDGSVLVELELTDLHEVKAWILSFGAKAVVEEPRELRTMIAEDVARLQEAYA